MWCNVLFAAAPSRSPFSTFSPSTRCAVEISGTMGTLWTHREKKRRERSKNRSAIFCFDALAANNVPYFDLGIFDRLIRGSTLSQVHPVRAETLSRIVRRFPLTLPVHVSQVKGLEFWVSGPKDRAGIGSINGAVGCDNLALPQFGPT